VDFFFILSGFVIAASYEEKLRTGTMSFARFLKVRVVRLWPLIILGIAVGAFGVSREYDPSTLAILVITGLLLIPTPYGSPREDRPALAVNSPSWSLLFEILVNIAYAAVAPKLKTRTLIGLSAVFGCSLLLTSYFAGSLEVGPEWPNLWGGVPRVLFAFTTGVLLYHLHETRHRIYTGRLTLLGLVALLCGAFAFPAMGAWDWAYDSFVVAVVFPLIVSTGALWRPTGDPKWSRLAGELSYPVYVLQSGFVPHMRGLPRRLHLHGLHAVPLLVMLMGLFCFLSWLAWKYYDQPVRNWLNGRGRPLRAFAQSRGARPHINDSSPQATRAGAEQFASSSE
jgi:peptidoglycan/LPS O-acetylase OafA/YrhL